MTVIHIIMTPQYLNSDHVTYYVITCKSAFDWVYAEQWYVIITFDVTKTIHVFLKCLGAQLTICAQK